MSFRVIDGKKYCFLDIVDKYKSGCSVLRSSHVGNFDAITTYIAQTSIPILLHEYLKEDVKVYRPMSIISRSEKKTISNTSGTKLALYNQHKNSDLSTLCTHYLLTKKLFKNTILLSDFLLTQENFLKDALEVISKSYPSIFNLYVDNKGEKFFFNGHVSKETQIYQSHDGKNIRIDSKDIPKVTLSFLRNVRGFLHGVSKTKRCLSGFILNTEMSILLVTIIDLLNKNKKEESPKSYHLSGLKMFNYLIGPNYNERGPQTLIGKRLDFMYKLLQDELIYLPKTIDFVIVPTSHFVNYLSVESKIDFKKSNFKNRDLFQDNLCTQYDLDKFNLIFDRSGYHADYC